MHPLFEDRTATRKRVILESPLRGETYEERQRNLSYARDCVLHSLWMGEAPIAFHLLYPERAGGVLEEQNSDHRRLGLWCGNMWLKGAEAVIFYQDHGMTPGMTSRLEKAQDQDIRIQFRALPEDDSYIQTVQEL